MLGSLLGLTRGRDVGLVYIDGHSDFNTLETKQTGAVAGMDLALATGRGTTELAHLRGPRPQTLEMTKRTQACVTAASARGAFRT